MTKKVRKAKWKEMRDSDGKILEAVFRIQEAQNEKKCARKDCVLGGRIIPLMKYARVFYEDSHEIEHFHYACFQREFTGTRRF